MLNNFKDMCQLMELQDLEPVSSVQVKGRLKENIAFWRDIGASKWVLSVIENGYYLPFISLPARRSFQNHPSVVQNQAFVCQELKKLLASGAIVEVRQEDVLVVNPLGVVKNASGKSRLILDLRYVNIIICDPASLNMRVSQQLQSCSRRMTGCLHLTIKVVTTIWTYLLAIPHFLDANSSWRVNFDILNLQFSLLAWQPGLMCLLKSREL